MQRTNLRVGSALKFVDLKYTHFSFLNLEAFFFDFQYLVNVETLSSEELLENFPLIGPLCGRCLRFLGRFHRQSVEVAVDIWFASDHIA